MLKKLFLIFISIILCSCATSYSSSVRTKILLNHNFSQIDWDCVSLFSTECKFSDPYEFEAMYGKEKIKGTLCCEYTATYYRNSAWYNFRHDCRLSYDTENKIDAIRLQQQKEEKILKLKEK